MHHFVIIEDTSKETRQGYPEQQTGSTEKDPQQKNILKSTARFLQKYFDQPNCVRIFISKN